MILIQTPRRGCSRNKQKVTDDERMVRLQVHVREYRMGQSKKNNPKKLATLGTQDEEKHNKQTTQYVLDTTRRKQTQITSISHEPSYEQLELKTTRTSFLCDNRNGLHNSELRTQRNRIGQHKKLKRAATRIPPKYTNVNSGARKL